MKGYECPCFQKLVMTLLSRLIMLSVWLFLLACYIGFVYVLWLAVTTPIPGN